MAKGIFLLFFLAGNCAFGASSINEACKGLREDIARAKKELNAARERNRSERNSLRDEIQKAGERSVELEKSIREWRSKEDSLKDKLEETREEANRLRGELSRAWEVLSENRKEAEAIFSLASPVGETFAKIDRMLASRSGSSDPRTAFSALFDVYLNHFKRVTQVRVKEAEAVLPDGSSEKGRLLACGGFGGVYHGKAGSYWIATLPSGTGRFHAAGRPLSGWRKEAAERAFAGKRGVVSAPFDISGGASIARLSERRTFREFLEAGGVIMIPIGLIAVLSLFMIGERLIFLRRINARIDTALGEVLPFVKEGNYAAALRTAGSVEGPVGRVLVAGVEAARESKSKIEEVLEDAILYERPTLERFLGTLAVFAGIAPLLGLLGTVSGMIDTFQVVTVYGTGNARLLSGGISEALITTEAGLAVAIPILLAHAWLSKRIQLIGSHMDRAAVSLAGTIKESSPERKPGGGEGEGAGGETRYDRGDEPANGTSASEKGPEHGR